MKPKTPWMLTLSLRSLQKLLATVVPAATRKTTIPALGAVKIEPKDGAVEFSTSNGMLSIRARRNTESAAGSAILLPAHRLEAYSRLLEGETATISQTNAGTPMLRCGGAETRIACISSSGFPLLEAPPSVPALSLKQDVVGRMLRFTSFAVSQEEKEANLRGALLEVVDGKAHMVATDGHRLSRYSAPASDAGVKVLIPDGLLGAIKRTVDGESKEIFSLAVTEATLFATVGGEAESVVLSHRATSGKFPNYRAIIPAKAEASIRLPAGSLVAALKRCIAIADVSVPVVMMTVSPEELRLSAVDPAQCETVDVLRVASSLKFQKFTAMFRGKYLLDALALIDGDVSLRFAKIAAQLGLWVVHTPVEGESFDYVLMGIKH